MRVLVLTPYPYGTTAGPRSSFELWEPVLRDADIALDYSVFETERLDAIIYERGRLAPKSLEMGRAYARFLPEIRDVRDYDAVLVNRQAIWSVRLWLNAGSGDADRHRSTSWTTPSTSTTAAR